MNLGHSPQAKLTRALRAGGATEVTLEAVRSLRCDYCDRHQPPKAPRPARVPEHPAPLTVVQLDEKEMKDWHPGKKRKRMGIICEGSLCHLVTTVEGDTNLHKRKAFRTTWSKPLGPPDEMKVDAARVLVAAEMRAGSEKKGTYVEQAAGEAHEQVGLVERHNGMFSDISNGVLEDTQPNTEEAYQECIQAVCCVKNQGLHVSGTTPEMAVFGRHRRPPGDLTSEDPTTCTLPLFDKGIDFAMKARLSARKRLAEWEHREAGRWAMLKRPRPLRSFQIEDRIVVWRRGKGQGIRDGMESPR